MDHDELRDYIDKFDAAGMVKEPTVAALRAIVELHSGTGISNRCVICSHGNPCETIQVIEKELG